VKPWTKIGPLGPFRGRLGLAWVIAPLVLGLILVLAVWLLLVRDSAPGGTFVPAGPESSFVEGTARPSGVGGAFVARTGGQLFAVAPDEGCPIAVSGPGYVDCNGTSYSLDGTTESGGLDLLPIRVHQGVVYVDPAHPVRRPSVARPQPGGSP
jgi:hypothetical protein